MHWYGEKMHTMPPLSQFQVMVAAEAIRRADGEAPSERLESALGLLGHIAQEILQGDDRGDTSVQCPEALLDPDEAHGPTQIL